MEAQAISIFELKGQLKTVRDELSRDVLFRAHPIARVSETHFN